MRVVELCEIRDVGNEESQDVKKTFKQKFKELFKKNNKAFAYAVFIAFAGMITFLLTRLIVSILQPAFIWISFCFAIIINFLVGASIISTISGYFKRYIETSAKGLQLIESKKIKSFGLWFRRHLFGIFDVFVVFYLM